MNLNDHIKIRQYHHDKSIKYGSGSVETLGWKNKEGQEKRFEVLSSIGNLNNCSILDAGCGYGDLFEYLNSRFENIIYFGIDFQDSFVENAINKYSHNKNAFFSTGDFTNCELPVTDYILASGVLCYQSSEKDYTRKVISDLFNSCRIGFSFNMLGTTGVYDRVLCYFNKDEIMEFCKSICSNVILKQGYYEDDFTVLMYK